MSVISREQWSQLRASLGDWSTMLNWSHLFALPDLKLDNVRTYEIWFIKFSFLSITIIVCL